DPRPAIGVFDFPGITATGTWTLMPEPGLMLMFPSWLRHAVLPYYGESSRITIAFNIRVGELTRTEESAGR
ncbi:MAG: putative 2OG-Fe(II) oxygenase, partial [Kiloniellales bacterium]|nr:putative 2OG-Fe(II) oxygenase [Kiloniellales bacterium]